jgi:16S rRNA (uracil1498-N3)-methyltransferase
LKQEYLSDIELYYSSKISNNTIELTGDESKHITKVMRHSVGDILHITNGIGTYFKTEIINIDKTTVVAEILEKEKYINELENIYFCFPRLKSNDRFTFELEKAIELGITNFIIIDTERTIPKGEKLVRWNKIALAAMKQSLRTYLPKIEYLNSFQKLNSFDGEKILLDQKSKININEYLTKKGKEDIAKFFIFGPEGGLSEKELELIDNSVIISLTNNRLRAETAVVTSAVAVSLLNK